MRVEDTRAPASESSRESERAHSGQQRGALGCRARSIAMHKVVGSCCAATSIIGGSAFLLSRAASSQPKKAAAAAARETMSGASVIHGSAGWDAPSGPIPHQLASVWCLMPHPEKVHKGGEDAAFGTPNAVGVADGVGGWASRGVDPGLYSKGLMASAERQALTKPAPHTPSPTELLRAAYDDVERQQVLGSTTAIVTSPCNISVSTSPVLSPALSLSRSLALLLSRFLSPSLSSSLTQSRAQTRTPQRRIP